VLLFGLAPNSRTTSTFYNLDRLKAPVIDAGDEKRSFLERGRENT